MSAEGKKPIGQKVGKGILYGFLVVLLLLILGGGGSAFVFEIPFHLIGGWVIHGWKALPPFFGKWQTAVLPLGCLMMAAVLAHRFIRRWVVEKRPALVLRVKHTAAVFSLILLGSAAAITASGVVHQMFWLGSGKLLESNMKSDLTMAASDGRQLMMALLEFEKENGRYPNSFEELELEMGDEFYIRKLAWLSVRDGQVPEPWIILRPGSAATALEPVIVSPLIAARGMVVVGYGEGTVRMIRAEELTDVIAQGGTEDGKGER